MGSTDRTKVQCPECSSTMNAKPSVLQRQVTCPKCKNKVQLQPIATLKKKSSAAATVFVVACIAVPIGLLGYVGWSLHERAEIKAEKELEEKLEKEKQSFLRTVNKKWKKAKKIDKLGERQEALAQLLQEIDNGPASPSNHDEMIEYADALESEIQRVAEAAQKKEEESKRKAMLQALKRAAEEELERREKEEVKRFEDIKKCVLDMRRALKYGNRYKAENIKPIERKDLLSLFEDNLLKAEKEYQGKTVITMGMVEKVSKDVKDRPYIQLVSAYKYGNSKCRVYVNIDQQEMLYDLQSGRILHLTARVNYKSPYLRLTNAEILAIGSIPQIYLKARSDKTKAEYMYTVRSTGTLIMDKWCEDILEEVLRLYFWSGCETGKGMTLINGLDIFNVWQHPKLKGLYR